MLYVPAIAAADDSKDHAVALGARFISKRFGHVQALDRASVEVAPGEVVALLGDNGAGKSTLLNSLVGVVQPDAGELVVRDRPVHLTSIRDAQELGIDCVYQDLALSPQLSVVDNMFLGHELVGTGLRRLVGGLARAEMSERADAALRELGIKLPSLTIPVQDLSGGQRQAVAVARAVMWSDTAVLMDEPTAALGARQSEIVCDLMRTVAGRGLGVLVVSHDLPRILKVADRVFVLWRGTTVLEAKAADLSVPELVATMVGFHGSAAA